ncbi:MAG: hypothetical protein PWQ12_1584 [Clostridiales bacterium]|nr:hypothetical protein [Clostridiales bacterium]
MDTLSSSVLPCKESIVRRIKGALIGCALGDAMGMPTEMWTRDKIKERYPQGVKTFLPTAEDDFFGRKMPAGSVTDDTANVVMILNSIVENDGTLNAKGYIDALIYWYAHSEVAALVTGPSTMRALAQIEKGVPLQETGKMGTTNGAAMKIAPIGMISDYGKMGELVNRVYQICMPTHNTNIAVSGASAVAACVSYGISGGQSVEDLWILSKAAVIAAQGVGFVTPSASLRFRINYAQSIVEEAMKNGAPENFEALSNALDRLYAELGTSVETIETIPAVLSVIALAGGDPMKAAQLSAGIGGDTDTIGAISCAICGAMHPDFDPDTVKMLESVNELDFEKLAQAIAVYSPYY